MAVADKIKALLKLQGKKTEDLAEALGLASKQALYNKFNRDSFGVRLNKGRGLS